MNYCIQTNWNGTLACSKGRYHFGPHVFTRATSLAFGKTCNHLIVEYPYDRGTTCGRKAGHKGPHMQSSDHVETRAGTIKVHSEASCLNDQACVIHNPSGHKMRDWPMSFRFDKRALIERQCSHGVGHPDPDSLMYFIQEGAKYGWDNSWLGAHGCDGCCA